MILVNAFGPLCYVFVAMPQKYHDTICGYVIEES